MQNFTIYGNPVIHSKSPQMHNAGFRHIHLEANYQKTLIEDGKDLKQNFIQNNIQGANITVPHKEVAFKDADQIMGLAKEIGAVNTYINEDGKVIAYNTDAPGFMKAIEEFGKIKKVIILGAGGTAKAIAVALKEAGIKTTVLNRSKNRLEFFRDLDCDVFSWDDFICEDYDLVVNSTSAGLKDDSYPTSVEMLEDILNDSTYAMDCIYGKMTPFLEKAKENRLTFKDGEDMLLYQGVLAFELFTGVKADKDLVESMRQGLKEA
ncbi:shikimate dehydrogenase [Arcobacteraceae bacterium]|nr:shikimate dehydrogenase [Arcobacteraceae bacterium]